MKPEKRPDEEVGWFDRVLVNPNTRRGGEKAGEGAEKLEKQEKPEEKNGSR